MAFEKRAELTAVFRHNRRTNETRNSVSLVKRFLITARDIVEEEDIRDTYPTAGYLDDASRAEQLLEKKKKKEKRTGEKEERKIETKKGNGNETKQTKKKKRRE